MARKMDGGGGLSSSETIRLLPSGMLRLVRFSNVEAAPFN